MKLSDWVGVDHDGTVTIRSGKVEVGQGILTALAQIAADELDVSLERIRVVAARTDASPDEGVTAGSMSIQASGSAIRRACAEVRAIYLGAAAAALGADAAEIVVGGGTFTAPSGHRTSYWALADDALLDREPSGQAVCKRPDQLRVVGTSAPRRDLPDKVMGRARFVHDLTLPGMLHGRVVRPPSRGARLISVDSAAVEATAHVLAVVREGSFLGVVAEREEVAVRAADELRRLARWHESSSLPDDDHLQQFLRSAASDVSVLVEGDAQRRDGSTRTVSAAYHRPYLAHASLGPSCAIAVMSEGQEDGGIWRVWTHSQGIFSLRRELARALSLEVERIVVQHVEGSGCYGHNGADDAAYDAVLLARAVAGRPVKVLWSRQDELGWSPLGPAAVVRIEADLDAAGDVVAWRHDIWGSGHAGRPGATREISLLAAAHTAGAAQGGTGLGSAGYGGAGHRSAGHGGTAGPVAVDVPIEHGGAAGRNAVPPYRFPAARVVNHQLRHPPLRTSSLRALGAHLNVFAAESFMDELALLAGVDPVAYRLRQLTDDRAQAVIEAAVLRGGWDARPGRGFGFARYKNSAAYCAVVAEVIAAPEVRLRRLTIAVDAGLVVNPDGLVNQIEGGAIQSASWTLRERVRFDRLTVTSDTYASYPILRFCDVPVVDVVLIDRPNDPSLGVGEAAQGPTAAAIGNALASATGVRVRDLPLAAPMPGGVGAPGAAG